MIEYLDSSMAEFDLERAESEVAKCEEDLYLAEYQPPAIRGMVADELKMARRERDRLQGVVAELQGRGL